MRFCRTLFTIAILFLSFVFSSLCFGLTFINNSNFEYTITLSYEGHDPITLNLPSQHQISHLDFFPEMTKLNVFEYFHVKIKQGNTLIREESLIPYEIDIVFNDPVTFYNSSALASIPSSGTWSEWLFRGRGPCSTLTGFALTSSVGLIIGIASGAIAGKLYGLRLGKEFAKSYPFYFRPFFGPAIQGTCQRLATMGGLAAGGIVGATATPIIVEYIYRTVESWTTAGSTEENKF